jgi:hypothetical protein
MWKEKGEFAFLMQDGALVLKSIQHFNNQNHDIVT